MLWIAFALTHGGILTLLGYDVDVDPKELAQEIYDSGGNVERCNDLRAAVPTMGPTLVEKKMQCIFEYASIAKDPSACALLMPSDYGLSCVGAAEDFEPCVMYADEEKPVRGEESIPHINSVLVANRKFKIMCAAPWQKCFMEKRIDVTFSPPAHYRINAITL